jgi:hypothetical protein
MDLDKPTIVVINGTADEGYWSVYYLLRTGRFNVRATVRRPESVLAERLRQLDFDGSRCEVVKASTDDWAALQAAVDGAQGIYGTTVYNIYAKRYRHDNPEELAQGHALIAAARPRSREPDTFPYEVAAGRKYQGRRAALDLPAPAGLHTTGEVRHAVQESFGLSIPTGCAASLRG